MKGRRKIPPRIPLEEFSVEYGDVNGIPLYETKRSLVKSQAGKQK